MIKEYQQKINQALLEGDESKLADIARELLGKLECAASALDAIAEGEEPHEVIADKVLKLLLD